MNIAITGATGFLGRALIEDLQNSHDNITAIVRNLKPNFNSNVNIVVSGNIDGNTDWADKLEGMDIIIHTAARVHVLNETTDDPLTEFRAVNTKGTMELAKAASLSGVKRFIFISSIKVHGEINDNLEPFVENQHLEPIDPYGVSKLEAENQLVEFGNKSGMEIVIIRPPLIYGPGVKANFKSMIHWVNKRVPLPFAKVETKRSLVSLDNIIDFIKCCISHPKAVGEQFLISDQNDLTLPQLLTILGEESNNKARLIPIPVFILNFLSQSIGRKDLAVKLLGNLQVNSSKASELLGWSPVLSVREGLKKTVVDVRES